MPWQPQPDFNRLLKALWREEPDRVPLAELIVDREIKAAFLGKPLASVADNVEFWHRAGYDYIGLAPRFSLERWAGWHDGQHGNIRDWQALAGHPLPAVSEIDFAPFDEVGKHLPDGMKVIAIYGDIFTTAWQMMGFTHFCYAMYEQPDFITHVMEELGRLVYDIFATMADYDCVGAMWYSDDVAYAHGLMAAPAFLRRHLFPWVAKIGALCNSRDFPLLYHSDGRLWEVMEDLVACGIDALHPIEPAAMDIAEVKHRYSDRLCLIGNVEVDILARGTEEQVRWEVRRLLREVAPGGGYCLGSSNSITDYVKLENYRVMLAEALASSGPA